MELREFIQETLSNIVDGVDGANKKHANRFRILGVKHDKTQTDGNFAEFDVSVVIESASGKSVGAKVGTPILSVISGNLEGKSDSSDSLQNAHRLKFKVYITEK